MMYSELSLRKFEIRLRLKLAAYYQIVDILTRLMKNLIFRKEKFSIDQPTPKWYYGDLYGTDHFRVGMA